MISLNQSCLSKGELEEIYDLLFKYRGTFNLRDEIGTCSNIEVDLQVIEKSPSLIRPTHVKREEKPMTDKEMQRSVHLGILKKDMSPQSSPIMLIARMNSILKGSIVI